MLDVEGVYPCRAGESEASVKEIVDGQRTWDDKLKL